jgi:acetoin utilization deacetylase AcuC-like enzyme
MEKANTWRCAVCLEEQSGVSPCRDCGCLPLPPGAGLLPLVATLLHPPAAPGDAAAARACVDAALAFLAAHSLASEGALQRAVDGDGEPRLHPGSAPVRARGGAPPPARPPLRFGVAPPPRVGLAFDGRMAGHVGAVEGAPAPVERTDRLRAAAGVLAGLGLLQACARLEVPEPGSGGGGFLAGRDAARVCSAAHAAALAGWEAAAAACAGVRVGAVGDAPSLVGPPDARFSGGTALAAALAVSAVCAGARCAARGVVDAALCLVRPPGHHACEDRAGGFCLVNNVGAAVRAVLEEEPGLCRVLVVDLDVHHCDGTQALFAGDPRVLTFSLHRWDGGAFYPGRGGGAAAVVGEGAGAGLTVNVPVDGDWVGDLELAAVVDRVLAPLGRAFDPQLVVVSLGVDSGRGDPVGDWDVTPAGYAQAVHSLRALGAPIVVALEGGYHLATLAAALAAVTRVLLGEPPAPLSEGERGVPVLPERAVLEGGDGGCYYGAPGSEGVPTGAQQRAAVDRAHARRRLHAGREWRAALDALPAGAPAPPHPGRAMGPRPAALDAIAATLAALRESGRWPGTF